MDAPLELDTIDRRILRALQADGRLAFQIVHTGQHYDREMNEVFFEELGIPEPDVRLGCGGGSHAEQTAKIMVAYEQLIAAKRPACCLVGLNRSSSRRRDG